MTVDVTVPLATACTVSAPPTLSVEFVMLAVTLDELVPGAVGSLGALSVQKLFEPTIVPSVAPAIASAPAPPGWPVSKDHPIAFSAIVPATLTDVEFPLAMVLVSARAVTDDESPASTWTSPDALTVESSIVAETAPLTRLTATMPPPEIDTSDGVVAFETIVTSVDSEALSTASTRTTPPEFTVELSIDAVMLLSKVFSAEVRARAMGPVGLLWEKSGATEEAERAELSCASTTRPSEPTVKSLASTEAAVEPSTSIEER